MEMIASKETLQKLTDDLLIREADLLIKFINQAREQLKAIKEIADKRQYKKGVELYEGSLLLPNDRELLKEAIELLVAIDEVTEKQLPEWRSSADLILAVGYFYNKVENDDELKGLLV